jgi:hypothetical protein
MARVCVQQVQQLSVIVFSSSNAPLGKGSFCLHAEAAFIMVQFYP